MMRWIAALTGSAALIAGGIVHGYWTDRWGPPAETAAAAAKLDAVPLEIGDWEGEAAEVKSGEAGAGVAGCIKRRYVNRKTGDVVSLFLVCGPFGPVSIHEPEACYGASGFDLAAKTRYETESGESMWRADATRTSASDETRLRLYWGWNGGGGWSAADAARFQFVRLPVLHKLYVVRELGGANDGRAEPCEEFLRLLLPVLRKTLY